MVVNTLARLLIARVTQGRRAPSPYLANLMFWKKAVSGAPRTPLSEPPACVDKHSTAITADAPLPSLSKPPAAPSHASDRSASLIGNRSAWGISHVMTGVLGLCLIATIAPLFVIFADLIALGIGSLNWAFFTKNPAPVGETGGGMANAIVGTLMLVGLATLYAVPVGLLAAIYLAEYRSDRLGPCVRFIGELLAGVPSIVIGIFAYYLVVKPMGHFSGWAGSFALGVMMVPIVMRASEEALKLVPRSIRQASLALGASHWQTVVRITVPAALPAMITAVCLAVARIAGETAPLLLTATDYRTFPSSPSDPTPS